MANDAAEKPSKMAARRNAGFDTLMGFEILNASRDEVVIEYVVDDDHLQPYGIVHGGVHCAIVEAACSTGAGIDAMARGQGVVGVENHTSFIRAVRKGVRLRATATPITRGRRSQVWEATIRDEQDRIIATGRVRLLCLEPGSELAGKKIERQG